MSRKDSGSKAGTDNGATHNAENQHSRVIELPRKHTFRKRLRDRAHNQKAALILSIVSVLILTVIVNQWVSGRNSQLHANGSSAVAGERGIASFVPAEGRQAIKWEHELALQLAVEKGLSQAALAEKPSLRDELVFGALQGRYGVKLKAGMVEGLEFLESQNGEEPLRVQGAEEFLKKYSGVWSKSFQEARLRETHDGREVYQLLDNKMTLVGVVSFLKDAKGRLMSMEFKNE